MPVVNIHIEKSLYKQRKEFLHVTEHEIKEKIMSGLNVSAERCHIMFTKVVMFDGNHPVFIDFKYLDLPDRKKENVLVMLQEICDITEKHLKGTVRLRGYPMNTEKMLSAGK